jgi:CO dehydrogenase nickel-insertion accessory protein CooC1
MTLGPNQSMNKRRMCSNERNSTARIVGIDMNNSVKVASTLGVKKAMMKMGQMKNVPQKYINKSFNNGHGLERLNKEGSPQRSDGKFYYVANGLIMIYRSRTKSRIFN